MLDTPCSEVVGRVLATRSIRQFPPHFPSRASPCAITFQLESTADLVTLKFQANKHPPLANSPYPEGLTAGPAKSSTGQNHALHNNWLPVDRGEVKHRCKVVTSLWRLRERHVFLRNGCLSRARSCSTLRLNVPQQRTAQIPVVCRQ
jgi:hypothetical protein